MSYNLKNNWVYDETVEETDINKWENGISQAHLFEMMLHDDKYLVTEFDTPNAGDITETIKLKSDDSVYATFFTEFDSPNAGDITETLICAENGISNKVVTEFDTPSAGKITETGGTV